MVRVQAEGERAGCRTTSKDRSRSRGPSARFAPLISRAPLFSRDAPPSTRSARRGVAVRARSCSRLRAALAGGVEPAERTDVQARGQRASCCSADGTLRARHDGARSRRRCPRRRARHAPARCSSRARAARCTPSGGRRAPTAARACWLPAPLDGGRELERAGAGGHHRRRRHRLPPRATGASPPTPRAATCTSPTRCRRARRARHSSSRIPWTAAHVSRAGADPLWRAARPHERRRRRRLVVVGFEDPNSTTPAHRPRPLAAPWDTFSSTAIAARVRRQRHRDAPRSPPCADAASPLRGSSAPARVPPAALAVRAGTLR